MVKLLRAFCGFLLLCTPIAWGSPGLSSQPEVQTFIQDMVKAHDFDPKVLESILDEATVKDSILSAIARPYEAKPWHDYQPLFVTDKHITNGAAFWKEHEALLSEVEKTYGVPPEVVVAILGVETRYGKVTGSYKVLDALSTLAFSYPPRAKFFKSELEAFLLMVREENLDVHALKGSYAGAIGAPQFIPSSYRAYAVDFSGTGQRDLFEDMADVVGSVGNYFKKHGWQAGAPIATPTSISQEDISDLVASRSNPKPKHTGKMLQSHGVKVDNSQFDETLALISLEQPDEAEYWLGYKNFYVITRYNHSSLYAMAVYQLSQKIKEQYNG